MGGWLEGGEGNRGQEGGDLIVMERVEGGGGHLLGSGGGKQEIVVGGRIIH